MMRPLILLVAMAVVLSTGGAALAQPGRPELREGRFAQRGGRAWRIAQVDRAALEKKREKVRERIRVLRAWKLTEALNLDEPTAARLFPILNRYDEQAEQILRELGKGRKELRRLVAADASDGRAAARQVEQALDRMVAQQRRLWDLQQARFADVRKVLTPQQAAQIFMLLPEIDRKLHRQLQRAARRERGPGPGGPGARRRGRASAADPAGPERDAPGELADP